MSIRSTALTMIFLSTLGGCSSPISPSVNPCKYVQAFYATVPDLNDPACVAYLKAVHAAR